VLEEPITTWIYIYIVFFAVYNFFIQKRTRVGSKKVAATGFIFYIT
jgi:hypothetical protein